MGDAAKVMLLGGTSQLGYSLLRRLGSETLTPICSVHAAYAECESWSRVNLDDHEALRSVIRQQRPDLLLHCGGICDVGKCEAAPEFAWSVNVESVSVLLDELPERTRLVYCSSDHVFGGDRGPYRESDTPHPISEYGRTRCAAEAEVARRRPDALIVRHGLGIGPSIGGRSGHLDWLRYRTAQGLPTTVIADEVRTVVWAEALVDRIWDLARSDVRGVRHVTATASSSRVELARYLDDRFGIGARLQIATRREQEFPHLGNVELGTDYDDALAAPLAGVVGPFSPPATA